ncbi:MAG: MFS transporter, partial [Elusimicrobiales bacterium]|nr:MFS transporter [Elusimicrobiales bacterium]
MREKLAIIFSFILIFAFNTADNAIAPLVGPLAEAFGVGTGEALWLITACTAGTVTGLMIGPAVLRALHPARFLLASAAALAVTQALFAMSSDFSAAILFRTVSGLGAGFIAVFMWRLAFHGLSKPAMPMMLAVLMSARPLATAIGVPLAALGAWKMSWQTPVWAVAALTAASGLALYLSMPARAAEQPEEPPKSLLGTYATALSVPHASAYYAGFTINRMAYFGFYAFCGLWFDRHYGLDLRSMGIALLIIGLAEALINFATPAIIKRLGHKPVFTVSLLLSGLLLPLFVFGRLPLPAAIAVISLFMLLDRVYSMALVMTIPRMFPQAGDKTAFGSLNTLTAWGGLMIISWFQGAFLDTIGMTGIEAMRCARPVVGAGHGGIPEWLEPGRGGKLFEPGSARLIAERYLRLLAAAVAARDLWVEACSTCSPPTRRRKRRMRRRRRKRRRRRDPARARVRVIA